MSNWIEIKKAGMPKEQGKYDVYSDHEISYAVDFCGASFYKDGRPMPKVKKGLLVLTHYRDVNKVTPFCENEQPTKVSPLEVKVKELKEKINNLKVENDSLDRALYYANNRSTETVTKKQKRAINFLKEMQ